MSDLRLTAAQEVLQTVHRLRAPGGCPWDREQTHLSLRPFVAEEAFEVIDALDRVDSPAALKSAAVREPLVEELGDLLLQILLHSQMASETGAFDFGDVCRALNEKLIRRHPHVFGETKVSGSEEVLKNWDQIKAGEKAIKPESVLDGVPRGMPALQRTLKVIQKVSKVGFQWPDLEGPMKKIDEEWGELKEAIHSKDANATSGEIGDLLFSIANVAQMLKLDPEASLRSTLGRFETRFKHVEARLREQDRKPEQATLEEMDRYWDEAKAKEHTK